MMPQPISIVGAEYCLQVPVDLTIVRNTETISDSIRHNLSISDADGTLIFKLKCALLTLHDRRVLHDSAGSPLLSMREKILTAHRRWEVCRGDGSDEDLLFSVKKSSMLQFRTKLHVYLASNTNQDACDFLIKGSWWEKSCIVYRGNSANIVAQMQEKEEDKFIVTVYPHVDYAFIVALIVLLNKIDEDTTATQLLIGSLGA